MNERIVNTNHSLLFENTNYKHANEEVTDTRKQHRSSARRALTLSAAPLSAHRRMKWQRGRHAELNEQTCSKASPRRRIPTTTQVSMRLVGSLNPKPKPLQYVRRHRLKVSVFSRLPATGCRYLEMNSPLRSANWREWCTLIEDPRALRLNTHSPGLRRGQSSLQPDCKPKQDAPACVFTMTKGPHSAAPFTHLHWEEKNSSTTKYIFESL